MSRPARLLLAGTIGLHCASGCVKPGDPCELRHDVARQYEYLHKFHSPLIVGLQSRRHQLQDCLEVSTASISVEIEIDAAGVAHVSTDSAAPPEVQRKVGGCVLSLVEEFGTGRMRCVGTTVHGVLGAKAGVDQVLR